MGIGSGTAALITGLVGAGVSAAGTAATLLTQPKPKGAPRQPTPPKTVTPEQSMALQRKRAAGAYGRSDTLLGGAIQSDAPGQRKTLLGQ